MRRGVYWDEIEGNLRVNGVLVGRRQWWWRNVWLVLEVEFSDTTEAEACP